MVWNVFVLGMDNLGQRLLTRLRHTTDYRFHPLLSMDRVVSARKYNFERLLTDATAELEAFSGSPDAVVGYWDFPTSVLAPMISQRFGLCGPALEAVLKCEHKYWSRLEQQAVVPDCVPAFEAIDPFSRAPLAERQLPYPFWLKPIKAHSSQLGYRVDSDEAYLAALATIRERIGRYTRPFERALSHAGLPDGIAAIRHKTCIAEALIATGWQCTLEGYVYRGEVRLTGIVDTITDHQFPSVLSQYVYPSSLPCASQARMFEIAQRVMTHMGYDNAPFNIEFFYDEATGKIWLLEINARLSRSHSMLFLLVDGAPHFQVMVDLALGIEPRMPAGEGAYPVAAKKMIRVFEDGVVTRVPRASTLARLEREFPGTVIELSVGPGTRLSTLLHQDEFSYELGVIFTGADSVPQLRERFRMIEAALDIRIQKEDRPVPAAGVGLD
ncbi:MAG: ATP-grasp domain-containing protein [Pseudomonadota bacterium]